MRKIKTILSIIYFLMIGTIYGYAEDKVLGIIIELTNGKKVEYRLADNPKLAFDGTTIVVTAEGVKLEFTPSELKNVTMGQVENVSSSIEEVAISHGSAELIDGVVRLSGFKAGEEVGIYSAGGIQYAKYNLATDGSLIVSLSSLPSGISIIRINKQTIKISKR